MEKRYTISESTLKQLIREACLYNAFEDGGIEDWSGYDNAIDDFLLEFKYNADIGPDEDIELEDVVDKYIEAFPSKPNWYIMLFNEDSKLRTTAAPVLCSTFDKETAEHIMAQLDWEYIDDNGKVWDLFLKEAGTEGKEIK